MKKLFSDYSVTIALIAAVALFSCNKTDDPLPQSQEAINIIVPDSSTIFADAGSMVDLSIFLATEQIIDSFRAGYLIDTAMTSTNVTFAEVDTIFLSVSYPDSSNTQSYDGSFQLPDSVTNVRMFRPYFPEQQNPYFPARYDAVRVVFQMSMGTETIEKQLKIIID